MLLVPKEVPTQANKFHICLITTLVHSLIFLKPKPCLSIHIESQETLLGRMRSLVQNNKLIYFTN